VAGLIGSACRITLNVSRSLLHFGAPTRFTSADNATGNRSHETVAPNVMTGYATNKGALDATPGLCGRYRGREQRSRQKRDHRSHHNLQVGSLRAAVKTSTSFLSVGNRPGLVEH
jgi:hypothetical protein